jgi:hypothetical protein
VELARRLPKRVRRRDAFFALSLFSIFHHQLHRSPPHTAFIPTCDQFKSHCFLQGVLPNVGIHHCLTISEIVSLIFSWLPETDLEDAFERWHHPRHWTKTAIGLKWLAALARTCKTFSDPALNLLWDTQDSLTPCLLAVFPNDLEVATRGKHVKVCVSYDFSIGHSEESHYSKIMFKCCRSV